MARDFQNNYGTSHAKVPIIFGTQAEQPLKAGPCARSCTASMLCNIRNYTKQRSNMSYFLPIFEYPTENSDARHSIPENFMHISAAPFYSKQNSTIGNETSRFPIRSMYDFKCEFAEFILSSCQYHEKIDTKRKQIHNFKSLFILLH